MNNYNTAICIVGICLVITALVILINHLRTKKTIDTIENMLNQAVKGDFSEKSFDETRLSSLETKFAHYLSASVVSARNVELEKNKIKSLIADISHQTKIPIANLLLYSELLLEDDTGNLSDQMRENIVQLHAQSEKLQFLIDSLVKLSRLENGILQSCPGHPTGTFRSTVPANFIYGHLGNLCIGFYSWNLSCINISFKNENDRYYERWKEQL